MPTSTKSPTGASAAPRLVLVALGSLALAVLVSFEASAAGPLGFARALIALPLVLGGGAALGPLLLVTPAVEPSRLKLTLFSGLLAPPLVAALWAASAVGLGLAPAAAWSTTFVTVAILAGLAARRRVGTARLGRAGGLACALAIGFALSGAWLVWSGDGLSARLLSPGAVAHATSADQWLLGRPATDPWFFGSAPAMRPAVGVWLAAVAGPAALEPLFALGLVVAWSLALTTLTAYLACAALYHGARTGRAGLRDVLAAACAPLAVAMPSGLSLAFSRTGATPHWLDLDPATVLARTYAFAALLAGLHATRRGARPWPGLCATLVALAALAQPWLGGAVAVALVLAGLATRRPVLPPLLLLALLPAFVQWRLFASGAALFETGDATWVGPRWALAGGLALLLGVGGARAALGSASQAERAPMRRGMIAMAAVIGIVGAVSAAPGAGREADALARFAFVATTVLVAGGAGMRPWIAAVGAGGLVLLAGSGPIVQPLPAYAGRGAAPFEETGTELRFVNADPLTAGLGEAFAFLRASDYATRQDVALLRGAPRRPGTTSASTPSLAPLLTGIPLWVDPLEPPGWGSDDGVLGALRRTPTDFGDTWEQRVAALDALYHERHGWRMSHERLLLSALERGTTLLCIVTELDRRRTTDRGVGPRGVDMILHRMGAVAVFDAGETSVYRLGPD